MTPREVDAVTMGELCVLIADAIAESGKPLPARKSQSDFAHFSAALAEEWARGNA